MIININWHWLSSIVNDHRFHRLFRPGVVHSDWFLNLTSDGSWNKPSQSRFRSFLVMINLYLDFGSNENKNLSKLRDNRHRKSSNKRPPPSSNKQPSYWPKFEIRPPTPSPLSGWQLRQKGWVNCVGHVYHPSFWTTLDYNTNIFAHY